jgi:hypothetical protein
MTKKKQSKTEEPIDPEIVEEGSEDILEAELELLDENALMLPGMNLQRTWTAGSGHRRNLSITAISWSETGPACMKMRPPV